MHVDMNSFVNEAAQHIAQAPALPPPPEAVVAAGVRSNAEFCDLWPSIRMALQTLRRYLPAWARWMVDALIAIGDRVCGER